MAKKHQYGKVEQAELQWLEDGIDAIFRLFCKSVCNIVTGVCLIGHAALQDKPPADKT